jgi:hypothetical protein
MDSVILRRIVNDCPGKTGINGGLDVILVLSSYDVCLPQMSYLIR